MKPAIILVTLLFGAGCAVGGFAWGFRMGYQGQVMSGMVTDARLNAALLARIDNGDPEFVRDYLKDSSHVDTAVVNELENPVYAIGEMLARVDLLR